MNLKNHQLKTTDIQVSTKKISKHDALTIEKEWQILEKIAKPSFFLSWHWISSWLKLVNTDIPLYLVIAKKEQNIIGLGIFCEKRVIKRKLIPTTQWFLHRTGDDKLDQIWVEHNDFLIQTTDRNRIRNAMWQHLTQRVHHIDEFIVNVAKCEILTDLRIPKAYTLILDNKESGYFVEDIENHSFSDYLHNLSKNTRQQFKRSISALNKLGDIRFAIIEDKDKQLEVLSQCQNWHIQKWQNSQTPSGFCNTLFVNFHQTLIRNRLEKTKTIICSLAINDELLGCLYCFAQENKVYFYLSCLKPMKDNKIKLGITLHILFIEWLYKTYPKPFQYDLLAGNARYKKSLAQHTEHYCHITIQKNSARFMLERFLKKIKNYKFLR